MEYPPVLQQIVEEVEENPFEYTYEQHQALNKMLACRTVAMGGHFSYCSECHTQTIFYNPCNARGCPICYQKNQIAWCNKLKDKILPIGHYHLVFSIPNIMAFIWLGLRKDLSSSFFHAVQHSFKLLRKQTGILLGVTMVFQSHGKSLSYKPHMHAMVTSGGMINNKWVTIDSLPYNQLRKAFQEEFQKQLLKKTSGAIHYDLMKIFSQSEDREWKLFPTFHRNTGNAIVNYLSHSICGVVIDMNQDFVIDYENKIIHFKEYRGTKEVWTSLPRDVFTDRYLNHIPQKHEVTIRNYGLYSNKYRKELECVRKENSMTLNTQENEIPDPEAVELCPVCGTPLKVSHYFQPGTIPDLLLPFIQDASRDPPAHGELIKAS